MGILPEVKPDKRQGIMESAIAVFSRKGYHGATMEDVATEAGLGKGTLYLYFSSKEELLRDILTQGLKVLNDGLRKIANGSGTGRERLEAMAFLELDLASSNKEMFRFILEGVGGLGQDLRGIVVDAGEEMLAIISKVVEDAIFAGELGLVTTSVFAKMFLGSIYTTSGTVLTGDLELSAREVAREIVRVLFEGGAGASHPAFDGCGPSG